MMVGNIGLNIFGARSTSSIRLSRTEASAVSLPFSSSLGRELSKLGSRELRLVHCDLGKFSKNATKAEHAAILTSSLASSKPT
ncbi:hypothetical protein OGATHE_000347 [Ogataea polymorpha]|uniref:Uncharacterized protein n=1 Tax=Ogataea polymorpha TaxID=460523 RepID=A0A9P8PSU3_9ASCO|nr:hypothetical protein OGATHE_000347 [Ogataea polymorpha]